MILQVQSPMTNCSPQVWYNERNAYGERLLCKAIANDELLTAGVV
jgi:hypothetical protein